MWKFHTRKTVIGLLGLVGLLILIWGVRGMSNLNDVPSLGAQVLSIPGTESSLLAQMPAIDLAIDGKEALNVVWRSVLYDNERPSLNVDKFLFIRGNANGASWGTPLVLADNGLADNNLRILATSHGLHVFLGRNVRHFVSRNDGKSWDELALLIPNSTSQAYAFDAAAIGDDIVVIYLDNPDTPNERQNRTGERRLFSVRWSPSGSTPATLITSLPKSMFDPPSPRLVAEGKRLHLMYGMNAERPRGERGGSVNGKLYYLRSDDVGLTWTMPAEVSLGAASTALSSEQNVTQSIGGIELLPLSGRLSAYYHDTALFVTYTTDGTTWTPPVEVTPHRSTPLAASFRSFSVSAASSGGRGRLVWVDTRYTKTDRRWWNPTGGFPWSDANPDWVNNDILSIPVYDISALNTSGAKESGPVRLTEPLSYAETVRVRASPARLFVLWSGRSKVAKELTTSGKKPELFYSVMPLP